MEDKTDKINTINNFFNWRNGLNIEIRGDKIMYDVVGHYKWLDDMELWTYYVNYVDKTGVRKIAFKQQKTKDTTSFNNNRTIPFVPKEERAQLDDGSDNPTKKEKRFTLIDNKSGVVSQYSAMFWNLAWMLVFILGMITGSYNGCCL